MSSVPSCLAESITCLSSGRPATGCRTFGRSDFMRLPWPAARMTTEMGMGGGSRRDVNAGILPQPVGGTWAGPQPVWAAPLSMPGELVRNRLAHFGGLRGDRLDGLDGLEADARALPYLRNQYPVFGLIGCKAPETVGVFGHREVGAGGELAHRRDARGQVVGGPRCDQAGVAQVGRIHLVDEELVVAVDDGAATIAVFVVLHD